MSPFSRDFLLENSNKSDELSWEGCSIKLVDGSNSAPFDLDSYVISESARALWAGSDLPLRSFASAKAIEVFFDLEHPLFRLYKVKPVELAAAEGARYIFDTNKALAGDSGGRHSVAGIHWQLLSGHWADVLEETPDRLREEIDELFEQLRERAPSLVGERAADFYSELDEEAQKRLVDNVISAGLSLEALSEFIKNGTFLSYLDASSLVALFSWAPDVFLDGALWNVTYTAPEGFGAVAASQMQRQAVTLLAGCLSDIALFNEVKTPDQSTTARARASLDVLLQRMA